MEGKTQEAAAAAAGMSVPTARKWASGPLPSQSKKARHWRTRRDPFAEVWATEVVRLLERDTEGVLEATTIFEELHRRYPGRFRPGQLRTLQRRIRDWRALCGPEKEVFFEQVYPPGREAAGDFTHATDLGVTVGGQLLEHLLFELTLSYSKRTWANVASSET
ncbi:MAG: IS21 family transposase, partial [Deltaproteobacteria bacterium]